MSKVGGLMRRNTENALRLLGALTVRLAGKNSDADACVYKISVAGRRQGINELFLSNT